MSVACVTCGNDKNVGRFCPACGTQQPAGRPTNTPSTPTAEPVDPLVGRIIGERYEILELINVGGMGRVYRGLHRALDRAVAIKLIHPHLLTSDAIVSRFMVEARTASRLNHPNVVSIFDFGRTGASEADHLFLVMELLTGPDLSIVLDHGEPMTFVRSAEILRQTLAALGQAHHLGITHRDIKPENIILEPGPDGAQVVKVIDFGIAKLETDGRLTQAGQLLGTPYYMAPELIKGAPAAPSVDLYAVGVMLFQMLTRRMPFEGANPTAILQEHLFAARPDPRKIAPQREIPDALAEVCMRALAVDPAARFPDARSLAEAISTAAGLDEPRISRPFGLAPVSASSPAPSISQPPARPITRPSILGRAVTQDAIPAPPTNARVLTPQRPHRAVRQTSSPPTEELALCDRDAELTWGRSLFEAKTAPASALIHGAAGTGRTRLLAELSGEAERAGVRVLQARAPDAPLNQCSYLGLRTVISALSGRAETELLGGAGAADPVTADGLRHVYGANIPAINAGTLDARRAAGAALEWAAQSAVTRANARALLAIDDVDQFDGASRIVLAEFLRRGGATGLTFLMTAIEPHDTQRWGAHTRCEVRALPVDKAADLMGPHRAVVEASNRPAVEALYVALALRWRVGEGRDDPPTQLGELIATRFRSLSSAQARVLRAIAVSGGGTILSVASLLSRPEELDTSLRPLGEAGIVSVSQNVVRLTHRDFARAALEHVAPAELAPIHGRLAESLADAPDRVELRAYHAARAQPDFETFLLVEQAARARQLRGDDDGAIAALWDGMHAATREVLKGDNESAQSACVIFGRKLGAALLATGRTDEAQGILAEVLSLAPPRSTARALVLEQLAGLEQSRGRFEEAARRQREAIEIAEALNDADLVTRLRRPMTRPLTGSRRPSVHGEAGLTDAANRLRAGRVSDVVVRPDARAEPESAPGTARVDGKDRG